MYDKAYQITEKGLALSCEKLPTDVNVELLNCFIDNAGILLCDAFLDHFPPACYIREPELMKRIWRGPYQDYVRYEMQSLVKNIVKYGSVDKALAKTKWNKDEQKVYLKRFEDCGFSPIPLRKNFSAWVIPNPSLILRKLYLEKPVNVEYIRSK